MHPYGYGSPTRAALSSSSTTVNADAAFSQAGGTHTTGALYLPAASSVYSLTGGSLDVADGIENAGAFWYQGGYAYASYVINTGTFNLAGGVDASGVYGLFENNSGRIQFISGSRAVPSAYAATVGVSAGATATVADAQTVTGGTLEVGGTLAKPAGAGTAVIGGATRVNVVGTTAAADVASGTLRVDAPWSVAAGGTLTKSGAGLLVVNGAQSHGEGSTLAVNGGTLRLNTNAGAAAARYTTLSPGGTGRAELAATQQLKGVSLSGNGTIALLAGRNKALVTNALAVGATALLDLTDNFLVVDYPDGGTNPHEQVWAWIGSARNSGTAGEWTGYGITTSLHGTEFGVGVAENTRLNLTAFGGEAVDATATLARQTYNGDSTLNGHVDSTDYAILAGNFGNTGMRWQDGDYTYDGRVDSTDYSMLAGNFGKNLNTAGGGDGAMMAAASFDGGTSAFTSPQPFDRAVTNQLWQKMVAFDRSALPEMGRNVRRHGLTGTGALDAWDGRGTFTQAGGVEYRPTLQVGRSAGGVKSGTYNLNDGVLAAGEVVNYGTFNFSGGNLAADFTNHGALHLRGGGTRTIDGDVVNNGTIKTWDTHFAYTGTFTNNGTYASDPADNFFHDLVISEKGVLTGGRGDRFFVKGDLTSASRAAGLWDTREAELIFDGEGAAHHVLSVTGEDRGPTPGGYEQNFAWGTLRLDLGESLALADGDPSTPGGAVYVGSLDLGGGLGQLASLAGNGLSVYYDPSSAGSAYLGGDAYALPGGGVLAPVGLALDVQSLVAVPEPGAAAAAGSLAALGLLGRRRRRAGLEGAQVETASLPLRNEANAAAGGGAAQADGRPVVTAAGGLAGIRSGARARSQEANPTERNFR